MRFSAKRPAPRQGVGGRLTVSILGAGLGAAALTMALTRPAAPAPLAPSALPAQVYTEAQIAAAKTKACAAWKLSSDGLIANMRHGGGGHYWPDGALGSAYEANLRMAYLSAALWLPTQVDPATPQDLRGAVNLFATTAGDSAAQLIDNRPQPDAVTKNLDVLNVARQEIEPICQ